jgi:serine/threonine protein kinase
MGDSAEKTKATRPSTMDGEPSADAMVAGRYRLKSLLGKGGMGSVWVGFDEELERKVAIKFMTPEVAKRKDLRERFNREAKAAARLRNRHVVQVHEYGVDGITPYIVMELLEGEDLQVRLRREKKLDVAAIAPILEQTAKALRTAQKVGVIHRDLKPANIFIALDDDDEETVKVLDFGVAKIASKNSEDATKSGVVLGSPPYMSPEQVRGKALDHRSDMWSLTAIAYRCLCGRVPFTGDTDGDIVVKICTEAPAPPSEHNPSVNVALDAVFEKGFERSPDDRYENAREFTIAFRRASGMQPDDDASASGRYTVPSEPGLRTPPAGTQSSPLPLSGPSVPWMATPMSGAQPIIMATPHSGQQEVVLTPVTRGTPMLGSPSGAPSGSTQETWEADPAPMQPQRRLVMMAAAIAAVVVIGAALALGTAEETSVKTDAAPAAAAEAVPDADADADAEPDAEPEADADAGTDTDAEPTAKPKPKTKAAAIKPRPPKASAKPKPKTPPPTEERRGWGY